MAAIWKYNMPLSGTVIHLMPIGAQPVSVAFQGDSLSLWAKVDDCATNAVSRRFHVLLTGQHFSSSELRFIGTAMLDEGYVVHVFEDPL